MAADPQQFAPPEVVCRALAKTFAAPGSGPVDAVSPTYITFSAGQTTALVGPSGCGKSTLLRLIAGLEAPSGGEVVIDGAPPDVIRGRAGLAVAFQDPSLLPWRSVRGNVALGLRLARLPADPDAVDEMIHRVGLAGFETRRPSELSGGMRQRAAIARCLISRPGLLLLDEPFGAVDELTRMRLSQELPRLWDARGTTAILVTHSVAEAVFIADRVIVLSPRPAQVCADIEIALDRPRAASLLTSDPFRALVREVSDALGDAIAQSSTALAAQ